MQLSRVKLCHQQDNADNIIVVDMLQYICYYSRPTSLISGVTSVPPVSCSPAGMLAWNWLFHWRLYSHWRHCRFKTMSSP